MTSTIVHQPRVAWDAALVLTRAAASDDATFSWCRDWIHAQLGFDAVVAFTATRRQLADPEAAATAVQVQQGLWRVRIEDMLRSEPGLAEALRDHITETGGSLR